MYAVHVTVINIVIISFIHVYNGEAATQNEDVQQEGFQYTNADAYLDMVRRSQLGSFRYSGIGNRADDVDNQPVSIRGASGFRYAGIGKRSEFDEENPDIFQNMGANSEMIKRFDLNDDKRGMRSFKYSGIGKRSDVQDSIDPESSITEQDTLALFDALKSVAKRQAGYRYAGIGKRGKENTDSEYNKRRAMGRRNSFRYAGIGKRDYEQLKPEKRAGASYRYAGLGKRVKGTYTYAGIGKRTSDDSFNVNDVIYNNDDIKRASAYRYAGIGKRNNAFTYAGLGKRDSEGDLASQRVAPDQYARAGKRGITNMRYVGIGKRVSADDLDMDNDVDVSDLATLTFPNIDNDYFDGDTLEFYNTKSGDSPVETFDVSKRSLESSDQFQNKDLENTNIM